VKTVLDALDTAPNEFESVKHENWTRQPRYRPKRVREHKTCKRVTTPSMLPKPCSGARNKKTVTDAPGSAENVSRSAKYEN
jgi:hypothetical protein